MSDNLMGPDPADTWDAYMEMGPEELTRYEGTQENIELREKIREKLAEADLRWTAGDQEPGTYENALADAVMVVVRPLLSHCTCGVPGLTYDGPREDCAVHGAVRALNMWQRRAERAEEERDEWRRVAAEQTRMERERAGNVEDALERVRRLHREVQYPRHDYGCCIECTNEDPEPYPCKTVRALEGNL